MAEKKHLIDNAKLMAEWNWERNTDLDPRVLTLGSHTKVWWKCDKGHEWQATVANKNNGRGCPYCTSKKALKGYNDLQTVNPALAKEWNYEKNNGLTPADVMPNSDKKAWWRCNKGHEWLASIGHRNQGRGCPYCIGKKILKGYNDLQTVNPTLAKEWNYEKNDGLTPANVTPNSNKMVWWRCSQRHEWQATINNRTNGDGCPYCSGRYVIKGENDLQTVNPRLANEWNYKKNKKLTPADVMPNGGQKVWWKCNKGHEWQATINARSQGRGCPICSAERNTSFPEYALVFYLEKYGLEVIHSYKQQGYELDVYVPSKKIAIEYDGYFWHKNKKTNDLEKNQKCQKDGITLYRIREGLPPLNDSSLDYIVRKDQKDLSIVIEEVLGTIIKTVVDIDIERDVIAIDNLREFIEKENSILFSNPDVANEWNYEKNGNLRPEHFTSNSKKKVWWKCSKGHEYQAIIGDRNKGRGCPYCTGKKVLKGYNDLQTVNPVLSKEWNYEKNNGLTPADVTTGSHKKVWWKCCEGHEWQAVISGRNSGSGCPYCSGRYAIKGKTDLQTVNPILAQEWYYEKNNELTPADVTPNSSKKVWWKCDKGHEWQSVISARNNGTGCPICYQNKRKHKS